MNDDLRVVALDNLLEERLNLGHMLRRVVHLPQTVANFVSEQVTALLDSKRFNQSIDSLELLEAPQTEETIDSFGDGRSGVLERIRIPVQIVVIDNNHFLLLTTRCSGQKLSPSSSLVVSLKAVTLAFKTLNLSY